jgi:hypothetical protein
VVRPNKRKRRIFEKVKRLFYLKYHIVAILDYMIILKVSVTSYRAADCTTLRRMLKSLSSFPGSVFEADRGFDAEYIFKKVYSLMMFPNIKQKKKGKGRGRRLRYRSNASKNFDFKLYRWRGMTEAIFGAEESKDQRLHTRFRKDENRERWGTIIAIGWDLKVLNRLRCTKELGMEVKSIIRN